MLKYAEIPEEPTVSGRFENVILQDDTRRKFSMQKQITYDI